MIITCPSCSTKFTIDENKIKGKSVKLKCSRCGHLFTPAIEQPKPEKEIENVLSPEKPPEEATGKAQDFKTGEEGKPMDDELKSAIDEALKEFQLTESKTASASTDVDFGEDVKPENEIIGDLGFSEKEKTQSKDDEFVASGFDLKPDDVLGATPDTPALEGFESTKVDTSGDSGQSSIEQDLIGDLEFELSKASGAEPAKPTEPVVSEDEFGIETPERTPTPTPSAPAFPKTPVPSVERKAPAMKKMPSPAEVAPSRGILPYVFFLLIVVAAGILGYTYKNDILSMLKGNPEGESTRMFTVVNSRYNFMQNIRGQTLFIVEGRAKNISSKTQNFLKLKVTLKDSNNNDIVSKEFYAGNIVSEESLRTEPAPSVEERFLNRVGDALSNMNIKPQDEVPFMVVFYDIPNVSSFSIEVLSSEELH